MVALEITTMINREAMKTGSTRNAARETGRNVPLPGVARDYPLTRAGQFRPRPGQIAGPVLPGQTVPGPGQIVQGPRQIVQGPRQIVQGPRQIAQVPGQIAQEPGQIAQVPGQIAQVPGQIAQEPGQIVQRPRQIAQEPGQIAQVPGQIVPLDISRRVTRGNIHVTGNYTHSKS